MIVWMKSDSVAIQLHSTDLCVRTVDFRVQRVNCLLPCKFHLKCFVHLILICSSFSALLQVLSFYFPDCGKLAPPVVQVQTVSFKYGPDKVTDQKID